MDTGNEDKQDDRKVYNIDRVLSFFSKPLVEGSAKYQTNFEKQKMPAIIRSEGTTGRIKIAERPIKAPKEFRKVSTLGNRTKRSNLFVNETNIVKDTNSNITIKSKFFYKKRTFLNHLEVIYDNFVVEDKSQSAIDLSFSEDFETVC